MAMCASRICCYWFLRFSVHFFIGIVTAFLCKRKIKKAVWSQKKPCQLYSKRTTNGRKKNSFNETMEAG